MTFSLQPNQLQPDAVSIPGSSRIIRPGGGTGLPARSHGRLSPGQERLYFPMSRNSSSGALLFPYWHYYSN